MNHSEWDEFSIHTNQVIRADCNITVSNHIFVLFDGLQAQLCQRVDKTFSCAYIWALLESSFFKSYLFLSRTPHHYVSTSSHYFISSFMKSGPIHEGLKENSFTQSIVYIYTMQWQLHRSQHIRSATPPQPTQILRYLWFQRRDRW